MNGVYDEIAPLGAELDGLRTTLADSTQAVQVSALIRALEATAQRISVQTLDTPARRDEQARLYRGFLAAARIVASLSETRGNLTR